MVTDNPAKAIWKKAIINAGINPLAAILNVPNGALLEKQESRDLLHELVIESLEKVAAIEGYYDYSIVEETEKSVRLHVTISVPCYRTSETINARRLTPSAARYCGVPIRQVSKRPIPTPSTTWCVPWSKL
jgi:hypothetical protein